MCLPMEILDRYIAACGQVTMPRAKEPLIDLEICLKSQGGGEENTVKTRVSPF